MALQLTRCDKRSLKKLIYISRQTFIDGFEAQSDPENFQRYLQKAFTPEVVIEELENKQAHFYFAVLDGKVCGYIKLRWDRSEEFFPDGRALEIQRVYVLKSFWNQGIGAQLLLFAEQFARSKSFNWVWLVVWFENKQAIRLYERVGYEIFARKDFMFGEEVHNDVVMRKSVTLKLSYNQ